MIDHDKLQKGRAWYVAGIVVVMIVVAWKFVTR
jgi:hypothetical protein